MNNSSSLVESLNQRIKELEAQLSLRGNNELNSLLEKRLFTAVEQTHDTIMVTDPDGLIVYVNPALERLTGYSSSELIGQRPSIFKSGQQSPDFYKTLWETISSGGVWKGRLMNRRKDGTLYQEEGTISPVLDEHGTIVNYVAVKHDVSRIVELEEQLAQSQKMEALGVLAGGIAHELNSPIQFIGDNLKFLSDTTKEIEEFLDPLKHPKESLDLDQLYTDSEDLDLPCLFEDLQSAINDSIDGSQRIRDIVKSIKTYTHPSLGMTKVDLNEVLRASSTMAKNEWKYVSSLTLELDPKLPGMMGNQGQLIQVFVNLIINAAHALKDSESGGQIEIETRNKDGQVVVQVKDNGVGMPTEILPKIFERFFTTKDVGKGTGQGLAICNDIVKTHSGAISVTSELGKGTCFDIRFPPLS